MAPLDWHPRRLAHPSEWTLVVPGQPVPIAVVRRLLIGGQVVFRAVTWAPRSEQRHLVGYYPNGDEAAEACWQRHLELHRARHEIVSRLHDSAERGRPAARE